MDSFTLMLKVLPNTFNCKRIKLDNRKDVILVVFLSMKTNCLFIKNSITFQDVEDTSSLIKIYFKKISIAAYMY
jgi:hypothetical protein